MAQTVKNLSAMQETQVPSLGQEDPLEKGMATHSSILACRIPWTEAGYSPWGHKKSQYDWATDTFTKVKQHHFPPRIGFLHAHNLAASGNGSYALPGLD